MRILFFATYPNQSIGYSRIAHKLSEHLAKKHEIYYFGISNFISDDKKVSRDINSDIKFIDAYKMEKERNNDELYGVNVICECIEKVKPDVFFIYNDLVVITRIFNEFDKKKWYKNNREFKVVTYLDLVYDYEREECINHVINYSDKIFTFSEHWRENIINICDNKVPDDFIEVLEHGIEIVNVNKSMINPRKFFGFEEDDFLILNTNTSNYRKAPWICIEAFILFLKKNSMNRKLKLVFRNNNVDDMIQFIKIICKNNKLDYNNIVNNHIYIITKVLSDYEINVLYECCDMGINTCIGEGFGLCNVEHAFKYKPQIISKVGAYNDIFKNLSDSYVYPKSKFHVPIIFESHCGIAYICDEKEVCDKINDVYLNYDKYLELYENEVPNLINKYNWEKIYTKLDTYFKDL